MNNTTLTSVDILPAPFAWVEIPAGIVTLEYGEIKNGKYKVESKKDFIIESYAISQYPITNAQYDKFIQANGYTNQAWWTEQGWEVRKQEGRTTSRYWYDPNWNKPDHPVVGITWFEAVAFCRWLSFETSENIMLPTEQQWQRAAQGDDGRTFPWGELWDASKCNNYVNNRRTTSITPIMSVMQYPKGASPYGVLDMSGNVWEWCLTSFEEEESDVHRNVEYRVARGGAWRNNYVGYFRVASRCGLFPDISDGDVGFRCVRS